MSKIDWLWYPYIPRGKLTNLGGDPGQGKSYLSAAIASALSVGDPLPGQDFISRPPLRTLMLTGEDDISDTVVPRLMTMNADLDMISLFAESFIFDDEGLRGVRQLMKEIEPTLLVIDPIVAYLGTKMDVNRANEVRPILNEIAQIGKDFNAGILLIRHLRKQPAGASSGKAIYSGMGSIDFTAAARSEMQVSESGDGIKYLNHVKANAGPKGKSIKYAIVDDIFHWGEQVDFIPSTKKTVTVNRKFKNEQLVHLFLFDLLRDHPDGLPASDVFLQAKSHNISDTRLQHVKGVVVKEKRGMKSWWRLDPTAQRVEPSHDDMIE